MTEEPEHSPTGASSAERWMNCEGSTPLIQQLELAPVDSPDYQKEGVAAHEAAAKALEENLEGFDLIGEEFNGVKIDALTADAIQMYLDDVRPFMTETATVMIEKRIGADPEKRPFPGFYGTTDFAAYDTEELIVEDYKHGEGITVDAAHNVQLLYYAYGIILERPAAKRERVVRLRICQPRAFHHDGPIREWNTTVGDIIDWAENELLPAYAKTVAGVNLDPGKWCRFCPAKLICPALIGLFRAAAVANAKGITQMTDDRLGQEYELTEAVNFYIKALKDETYRRLIVGKEVPGTKLVPKLSHRVYRPSLDIEVDGEKTTKLLKDAIVEAVGDKAYAPEELRSPAELEKLGPKGKEFAKLWAYKPDNGLTVTLASDKKVGVKVASLEKSFAHLVDNSNAS